MRLRASAWSAGACSRFRCGAALADLSSDAEESRALPIAPRIPASLQLNLPPPNSRGDERKFIPMEGLAAKRRRRRKEKSFSGFPPYASLALLRG